MILAQRIKDTGTSSSLSRPELKWNAGIGVMLVCRIICSVGFRSRSSKTAFNMYFGGPVPSNQGLSF
jgi:hypothetical protein